MNIRDKQRKQLEDLAEHLETVAAIDQPSAVDWKEAKQALSDDATFLRTYVIPRIVEEPRYSSGNGHLAEYVPAPTLEVEPDDSTAGTPFLVPRGKS